MRGLHLRQAQALRRCDAQGHGLRIEDGGHPQALQQRCQSVVVLAHHHHHVLNTCTAQVGQGALDQRLAVDVQQAFGPVAHARTGPSGQHHGQAQRWRDRWFDVGGRVHGVLGLTRCMQSGRGIIHQPRGDFFAPQAQSGVSLSEDMVFLKTPAP